MAIHPLGQITIEDGEADRAIIRGSLAAVEKHGTQQWVGYSFSWMSCLYARAGQADQALRYLKDFERAFILRNGFHANGDQAGTGLSSATYRPFTLEGNFLAMEAKLGRADWIDPDKVVLRGFSMGGAGTWHIGLHRPDRWCVIGPGAGFTRTHGYVAGLPEKLPSEVRDAADDLAKTTGSANRKLRQIEEILDLFQPFTHDNFLVFECRAVAKHRVKEPEFHFRVEDIDWRRYWLDIHMPGLRRWCFPQYENKDKEIYEPVHPFTMIDVPASATTTAAANDTGT